VRCRDHAGTATSSSKCSGGRYSFSFLAEYRPVPRVTVYGGVAGGYQHTENVAPTVGARFSF
jgi:hypothetical protein